MTVHNHAVTKSRLRWRNRAGSLESFESQVGVAVEVDFPDGFTSGPRRQEGSLEFSGGAEKWVSLLAEEAQKIIGKFLNERRRPVARKILLDRVVEQTIVLQNSRNQRCPSP